MRLSEIWVYPIKSLGGVSLASSRVLESGLELDRRFMLVNEDNEFMTQRQMPTMATLGTRIKDTSISVFEKSNPSNEIQIPYRFDSEQSVKASIWEARVDSMVASQSYNEWFSDYFRKSVRLVRMNHEEMRSRKLSVAPYKTDMSYADGYPFLVLSKASVAQLNAELEELGESAVNIRQFRANLIVDQCEAFEEDKLNSFTVGDCYFNMVKPCARCQVITVDQDTGLSSKQPLKHLAKTRNSGNKVIFGMNAAFVSGSTITAGDEIVKAV